MEHDTSEKAGESLYLLAKMRNGWALQLTSSSAGRVSSQTYGDDVKAVEVWDTVAIFGRYGSNFSRRTSDRFYRDRIFDDSGRRRLEKAR